MTNDIHKNDTHYSQQTICELLRYNIPPSPKCYEVMFEFIKGENIDIKNTINKFLEKKSVLNEAFLLKVHASVLSYDAIARAVDTVTNMLTTQITGLNDSVSSSDQELDIFTNAIDSFSAHIDNRDNANRHLERGDNDDENIINYINQHLNSFQFFKSESSDF